MSTPLELEALPEAFEAVKENGTTATFTLYPSAVTNTDDSEVTLGAPVEHVVRIIPPDDLSAEFAADGSLVLSEGVSFAVMSGALTSEPIAFVPAPGQHCTVRGKPYRVRSVRPEISGDHVAYYEVEARA